MGDHGVVAVLDRTRKLKGVHVPAVLFAPPSPAPSSTFVQEPFDLRFRDGRR
jgi:hypothetical protein